MILVAFVRMSKLERMSTPSHSSSCYICKSFRVRSATLRNSLEELESAEKRETQYPRGSCMFNRTSGPSPLLEKSCGLPSNEAPF